MRNGSGVPKRQVGMSSIVVFRIRIYSGIGLYGRCSRFLTSRKSGGRRGALECERAVALTHDEGALRRDLKDSVGVEVQPGHSSAPPSFKVPTPKQIRPSPDKREASSGKGYFGPKLKVERH